MFGKAPRAKAFISPFVECISLNLFARLSLFLKLIFQLGCSVEMTIAFTPNIVSGRPKTVIYQECLQYQSRCLRLRFPIHSLCIFFIDSGQSAESKLLEAAQRKQLFLKPIALEACEYMDNRHVLICH